MSHVPDAFTGALEAIILKNFSDQEGGWIASSPERERIIQRTRQHALRCKLKNQDDTSILYMVALENWDDMDANPGCVSKQEIVELWNVMTTGKSVVKHVR